MIGTCRRCAKSQGRMEDPDFMMCSERGRVNVWFAGRYHDCFVPREERR